MLDRTNSNVVERVVTLVQALLAKRWSSGPSAATKISARTGLSSLDLVNLMLAVEAEFDLKIPGTRYAAGKFPLDRAN